MWTKQHKKCIFFRKKEEKCCEEKKKIRYLLSNILTKYAKINPLTYIYYE